MLYESSKSGLRGPLVLTMREAFSARSLRSRLVAFLRLAARVLKNTVLNRACELSPGSCTGHESLHHATVRHITAVWRVLCANLGVDSQSTKIHNPGKRTILRMADGLLCCLHSNSMPDNTLHQTLLPSAPPSLYRSTSTCPEISHPPCGPASVVRHSKDAHFGGVKESWSTSRKEGW